MYAFIRRYRMGTGNVDDLMRKVDTQFASQLSAGGAPVDGAPVTLPEGIVSYHAVDTGDGTIVTVTLFETAEQHARAQGAAAAIRESLSEFEVEEIDTHAGPVKVSRSDAAVLAAVTP